MIVIISLFRRPGLALLSILLLASACSTTRDNDGLTVLVTTSLLGDVTEQLVGKVAIVEVLIPTNADPHGFQLSARQAASLRDADVVIANGLGLEAALTDVLAAAQRDGVVVVEVGPAVMPLAFTDSADPDPHFWLDPLRMSRAAEVIVAAVAELAEPEREALNESLEQLQADLTALDNEIVALLAGVTNRKLVANHDSLGYLAARYDFEVVGTVLPGGSTLASPSPRDISNLIDSMQAHDVRAVFTDATEPDSLAQLIADESKGSVEVVELYIGSLGPAGSGAESYAELVRINAERISGALG